MEESQTLDRLEAFTVHSAKFQDYTGGVYSEKVRLPMINHEISVVGCNKDATSGEYYCIGRNAWDTYVDLSGNHNTQAEIDLG